MIVSSYRDHGSIPAIPVAILAGGLATRLRPLTTSTPKAMVSVAGEPFIAHQLRLLSRQGFVNIVLCVGRFGYQIEVFVGDGGRFGCKVRYSWDGDEPLGTGGAIRHALPLLGEHFAVLYGDSYLTAPLTPALHAFATAKKPALMTVLHNAGRFDDSNVELRQGDLVRYQKGNPSGDMEYIDYGLSFYSAPDFLQSCPHLVFDLSDVQKTLIAQRAMAAFEVNHRFYEIGSPRGLKETEGYLKNHALQLNLAAQHPQTPGSEAAVSGGPA